MCARFELNKTRFQPTNTIAFWRGFDLAEQLVWAGFARREYLRGPERSDEAGKASPHTRPTPEPPSALVDIPADRYCERSRRTALFVWEEMPRGHVIRGLVIPSKSDPARRIVRIVTRAVTPEELAKFGHDRICVTEPPLYHATPISIAPPPLPPQAELF